MHSGRVDFKQHQKHAASNAGKTAESGTQLHNQGQETRKYCQKCMKCQCTEKKWWQHCLVKVRARRNLSIQAYFNVEPEKQMQWWNQYQSAIEEGITYSRYTMQTLIGKDLKSKFTRYGQLALMKQFANNMLETEKLQLQKTSQCQNLLVPHPVPTLEELFKLCQKPLLGGTDLDVKLNNKAFIYFVEFVLPKIAGAKGRWEEMCLNQLSDKKITLSDEVFALLCCKNMWDKWNADDSTTMSLCNTFL